MAYDPNMYSPYRFQPQIPNPQVNPINGLVHIKDIEMAKSYQMPPNSVSPPLMLESDNVFVVKETDGSGGATLSAYRFEEIPLSSLTKPEGEYVTKADFDKFATEVMEAINGKHVAKPAQAAE